MNAVMAGSRGTGRHLRPVDSVRVYGKTGTADVLGMSGEEAYGIARGKPAPPHSWFVALAESRAVEPCAPDGPGRIAIAVVVPRGGAGSGAAGRTAMAIVEALRELGYFNR
jgi:cell division protein FtsI/penicillin-binding protein 2